MNITTFLADNRDTILKRWKDSIMEVYPEETVGFMQSEKDRFNNPFGHAVATGTVAVLDCLERGDPIAGLRKPLEEIIRIRAVQELTPADALRFVFQLRKIIHDIAGTELEGLDARIDGLALLAFDIYSNCRQEIFEIRAGEMRRRTRSILERFEKFSVQNEKGGGGE